MHSKNAKNSLLELLRLVETFSFHENPINVNPILVEEPYSIFDFFPRLYNSVMTEKHEYNILYKITLSIICQSVLDIFLFEPGHNTMRYK